MEKTISLSAKTLQWLEPLKIWPYRLTFRLQNDAEYEVPRLRGIWGRALRLLDDETYKIVFEGTGPVNLKTPRYIIRPANAPGGLHPVARGQRRETIDFITWGVSHERWAELIRSWDIASGMGIGRQRQPFIMERTETLASLPFAKGVSIAEIIRNKLFPKTSPCRIDFSLPLRIMTGRQLNYTPKLPELIPAALSRLALLRLQATGEINSLSEKIAPGEILPDFADEIADEALRLPAEDWTGEPIAMRRYSGRQKAEIDLYGAVGGFALPNGCGELGPILAAAEMLHIGKSTTLGFGRPDITLIQ